MLLTETDETRRGEKLSVWMYLPCSANTGLLLGGGEHPSPFGNSLFPLINYGKKRPCACINSRVVQSGCQRLKAASPSSKHYFSASERYQYIFQGTRIKKNVANRVELNIDSRCDKKPCVKYLSKTDFFVETFEVVAFSTTNTVLLLLDILRCQFELYLLKEMYRKILEKYLGTQKGNIREQEA